MDRAKWTDGPRQKEAEERKRPKRRKRRWMVMIGLEGGGGRTNGMDPLFGIKSMNGWRWKLGQWTGLGKHDCGNGGDDEDGGMEGWMDDEEETHWENADLWSSPLLPPIRWPNSAIDGT